MCPSWVTATSIKLLERLSGAEQSTQLFLGTDIADVLPQGSSQITQDKEAAGYDCGC